VKVKLKNSPLA